MDYGLDSPGSSEALVSWVLSAYAIIFAAVLVPAGRLADQYGRKRVLLGGVAVFTAASAVASFAPTLGVLIAARAVQAVGAAMIVHLTGPAVPQLPEAPAHARCGHLDRGGRGRRLCGTPGGIGLALGVALLVALTNRRRHGGFKHAWAVQAGTGAVAADCPVG